MFLPTTVDEMRGLGWSSLDVIIVTGDTYIDSPFMGAAVIGNTLQEAGYRVGVIAQPETGNGDDIRRLGEPGLFWGISAGATDSMVANYTALKKKRRTDDFTPGGLNDRRPDRATIVYTNLVRQYFKHTRPIVLGGIEASLRRVAHYDYWDDKVRRAILFDAKADLLVYGMGEQAVLELARRIKSGEELTTVRGTCCICDQPHGDAIELPCYEKAASDKGELTRMFNTFYRNNDPLTARTLQQKHGERWLIHNPPSPSMSRDELDAVYEMRYTREVHPYYRRQGVVRAQDTIRFSVTSHRGCYGECNFCAIAVHQGRTVISRSEGSIVREVQALARLPGFKGVVADVGGPTANMFEIECPRKLRSGSCPAKRCLYPQICKELPLDHRPQVSLLKKLRSLEGVKAVFVASGIRVDMVVADERHGVEYLREVVGHHVSGQLRVAPEHFVDAVLARMGKPGVRSLSRFREAFARINSEEQKKQFLTYYLIAAHPGCELRDMRALKAFVSNELRANPERVQVFTPVPSTYSTLMYYTGKDPFTGEEIFVERSAAGKTLQKEVVMESPQHHGRGAHRPDGRRDRSRKRGQP